MYLVVHGGEGPRALAIEGVSAETLGDVDGLRHVLDGLEGTLNAVEDVVHDAGTELDGQRRARAQDGVTDSQTR
jgi:hypothetical protein